MHKQNFQVQEPLFLQNDMKLVIFIKLSQFGASFDLPQLMTQENCMDFLTCNAHDCRGNQHLFKETVIHQLVGSLADTC